MMESPVLLITFNRPDNTQQVLDAIRKAKPEKLYIFNDGPREGNNEDLKSREQIKKIVTQIEWECKLILNFSEKNLGCGLGVSSAISWVFETEDTLIILEDDCVPSISFFDYCNYCLEKYKNDERIMQVAGNNYTENYNFSEKDYFFSKYGHIWGWATWKCAWSYFDYEMKDWPIFCKNGSLNNVSYNKREIRYFKNMFDSYYNDYKKPWAIRWLYAKIKRGGVSIVPRINLIKNIGSQGMHTKNEFKYNIDLNTNFKVNNEPTFVLSNKLYDKYHFKHYIDTRRNIFTNLFLKTSKKMKSIITRL